MSRKDFKKEPVFSESDEAGEHISKGFIDSHPPHQDGLDPRLRLAAFAVMIVCSVFLIEWAAQKYLDYRAVQAAKALLIELEESNKVRAARAEAMEARTRREAERRRLALRDQRARTNQGTWLAKNCSDWRRAYEDLGAPTAEREMKRHCRIYEEYLDSGIVVAPVD